MASFMSVRTVTMRCYKDMHLRCKNLDASVWVWERLDINKYMYRIFVRIAGKEGITGS